MMKGGTGGSSSAAKITDNKKGEIQEENDKTTALASWGTWDELLLACAVKRHGVKDWESVAMEVQGKTSLPNLLTTAHNCQLKYQDLRRRFTYTDNDNDDAGADAAQPPAENHDLNIPWLDDLRDLRVSQLRQELHRYDVSILSLQLKVKRLEEEGRQDNLKPDLEEDDSKGHTSQNNKIIHDESDRSKPDPENQSVNGSNSTCSKDPDHRHNKPGPGPQDRVSPGPDRALTGSAGPSGEPAGSHSESESESDKGSTQTAASDGKDGVGGAAGAAAESSELGGGDSAGEMRESSEAQSSAASLRRKWNAKRRRKLEIREQQQQQQRDNDVVVLVKSQPLVEVLQLIRAHEHSSLYERRLPTQESDKYKSMVQQHLDLGSIQAKLNSDSYCSCTLSFYRDLLLLFNNAVVFFPKSSPESRSAHQLRRLVLNEMKKKNLITRPNHYSLEPSDSFPVPATTTTNPPTQQPKRSEVERSDSLLAKHKSTAPIIVCRKRSSIASKPSAAATSFGQTAQKSEQQQQKEQGEEKTNKTSSNDHVAEEHGGSGGVVKSAVAAKAKDNPVPTGTRSSRRKSIHQENNPTKNASASTKKRNANPANSKSETSSKAAKKAKTEAAALDKKRSTAADFLKRIKRNLPADTLKNGAGTSTRSDGEQKRRGGGKVGKVKERVVLRKSGDKKKLVKDDKSSPSKRNVGRPSKKAAAEAANAVASPKRARESGGKQEASRRPRKRTRR